MEPLLISACLLGTPCRYDGASKPLPAAVLARLRARYELIPVCPERLGGLPTPRTPAERRGDAVVTRDGRDVTDAYARGAALTLETARSRGCRTALLKARSPACGKGRVYDGSFTGTTTARDGVAAELLRAHGIAVFGEDELENLIE